MKPMHAASSLQLITRGFLPGLLIVMILPLILILLRSDPYKWIGLAVLAMEVVLMALGFLLVAQLLARRHQPLGMIHARLAGIGAVLLLGVASALFQGVSIWFIACASLLAGMLATVGALACRVQSVAQTN